MADPYRQPSLKRGNIREPSVAPGARGKKTKKGKLNDVYAVEKVMDKRYVNGRCELLLKWQGCPPEQNSWEPIENLTEDSLGLVAQFEMQCAKQQVNHVKQAKKPPQSWAQNPQQYNTIDMDSELAQDLAVSSESSNGENSSDSESVSGTESGSVSDDSSDDEEEKQKQLKQKLLQSNFNSANLHCNRDKSILGAPKRNADRMPIMKASVEAVKHQPQQWQEQKVPNRGVSVKFEEPQPKSSPAVINARRRKTMHADEFEQKPVQRANRLSQDGGIDRNLNRADSPDRSASSGSNTSAESFEFDSPDWNYNFATPSKPYGVDRGLSLEKIVRCFSLNGEIIFIVQWKNFTTLDAVLADRMMEHYPHLIIQYFETLEHRPW